MEPSEASVDVQSAFNLAWWIISALRVKSLSEFLVPAVCDYSWSVVAGLEDNSCRAQLLEDVPQAHRIGDLTTISQSDFEWVFLHLTTFADLLENPRFRLAVDALTTHQQLINFRMMVASLWSGLEALMGISSELTFRISLFTACILEGRGEQRTKLFRSIRKLYEFRSKAVHGATITDEAMKQHIIEVRHLLSQVIQNMVETQEVPTVEGYEKLLLE